MIEYLREENRVLRDKVGKSVRLTDPERRRLAALGARIGRRALAHFARIATPDTILRWHRELVAAKYDGSKRRQPGRPRKPSDIVRLLLQMARENATWGYTRLRGALRNVGIEIGRSTIKRILKEQGIDPAPMRGRRYPWATFIKAHLGAIAAADFFTVEVLSWAGVVRYHVFFVIDIATRRVEVAGITRSPDALWMDQMARNLLDGIDGFLLGKRYLVLDRDPLYTKEFRKTLRGNGVGIVRLPGMSPNLNAFSERFVLSIKSECLERVVPLGEWHLRHLVRDYLAHYHQERNHQGLRNALIESSAPANMNGHIRCRHRLGGVLSYYFREAA